MTIYVEAPFKPSASPDDVVEMTRKSTCIISLALILNKSTKVTLNKVLYQSQFIAFLG